MWDNRESKKKPSMPDFKCRDKECDGAVWIHNKDGSIKEEYEDLDTPQRPVSKRAAAAQASPPAPAASGRPLSLVYKDCFEVAAKVSAHYLKLAGIAPTAESITAAAATIFIGATNTGRPVKAAKQLALPLPPTPKAIPQPIPDFEDFPPEDDSDSDLPF